MGKIIKAIVVGFGNRGEVYADYSLQSKNELEIVGICDPSSFKLKLAKEKYHLNDDQLYSSVDELVNKHPEADIIINATMDQDHYKTGMAILSAGYNMLIEKPIVPCDKQLTSLANTAKKNNCQVFVCHVLRYTMFYRTIKQLLLDKKIGDIVTIEMNEHVCLQHYLTSYLRGKWNNEKECGSGLILAKSCHDLDILCWLNNETEPSEVSSFGGRYLFTKENKPKDATTYCYECPHKHTCQMSAVTLYEDHDTMPFLVYDRLNKPLDSLTKEEKIEFLHHDIYGKCAYDVASDLVDRQGTIVKFKNGSVASFTLVGCATRPNRYIHIIGSHGEIEGKIESNKITVQTYDGDVWKHKEEVIDLSDKVVNLARFGGHNGGDFLIMHDLCAFLNGDKSSISITKLADSLNGHRAVYAAEKSRKTHKTIKF